MVDIIQSQKDRQKALYEELKNIMPPAQTDAGSDPIDRWTPVFRAMESAKANDIIARMTRNYD
jgi:hypothetical protein